ncbi:hypothetical protein RRG08_005448 [Elysia crispata]|uniref:Uncharacterized protein n=1 Tax=Elysia crispata TaxID=231223 RepID=A0AAE0Y1X2_9GAST|nr:hypothetical protein RRG08_005448 [Elysia crispata]
MMRHRVLAVSRNNSARQLELGQAQANCLLSFLHAYLDVLYHNYIIRAYVTKEHHQVYFKASQLLDGGCLTSMFNNGKDKDLKFHERKDNSAQLVAGGSRLTPPGSGASKIYPIIKRSIVFVYSEASSNQGASKIYPIIKRSIVFVYSEAPSNQGASKIYPIIKRSIVFVYSEAPSNQGASKIYPIIKRSIVFVYSEAPSNQGASKI